MNLKKVTITGADDSTDIKQLVDLSAEFPFVEWGILVSHSREGSYRFPARPWVNKFMMATIDTKINVSTHLCGKWVKELVKGTLKWGDVPLCIRTCQRVQINTHAQPHDCSTTFIDKLEELGKEYIFQWDGVNSHLANIALESKNKISILFDLSGGDGILPDKWPLPQEDFDCGYAGGLGPHNVVEQVNKIEALCNKPYWIDMERRVRTENDAMLDMAAVRKVLEATKPLIGA